MKLIKRAICIIIVICAALTSYFTLSGYKANSTALQVLESPAQGVTVEVKSDEIDFVPEHIKAGFVFYPGAMIEYKAYAPLMNELASQGILCVIAKMPLNFALFKMYAADSIISQWDDVNQWYIGGHSLGGVAASYYLKKNADCCEGLVLLASYSSCDLSDTNLRVLSIYGTNDEVLVKDQYEGAMENYPSDFTEHIIEGGCHSYFGSYGMQKGDGTPSITPQQQWKETADTIVSWIEKA